MIGWLEAVYECCQLWKRGSLWATAPPPGVAGQFKYCGGRGTTVIIIIITSVTWHEIHGSLKLSLHSALRVKHCTVSIQFDFSSLLKSSVHQPQQINDPDIQNHFKPKFSKVAGVHPKVPLFKTEHIITSDVCYISC